MLQEEKMKARARSSPGPSNRNPAATHLQGVGVHPRHALQACAAPPPPHRRPRRPLLLVLVHQPVVLVILLKLRGKPGLTFEAMLCCSAWLVRLAMQAPGRHGLGFTPAAPAAPDPGPWTASRPSPNPWAHGCCRLTPGRQARQLLHLLPHNPLQQLPGTLRKTKLERTWSSGSAAAASSRPAGRLSPRGPAAVAVRPHPPSSSSSSSPASSSSSWPNSSSCRGEGGEQLKSPLQHQCPNDPAVRSRPRRLPALATNSPGPPRTCSARAASCCAVPPPSASRAFLMRRCCCVGRCRRMPVASSSSS